MEVCSSYVIFPFESEEYRKQRGNKTGKQRTEHY